MATPAGVRRIIVKQKIYDNAKLRRIIEHLPLNLQGIAWRIFAGLKSLHPKIDEKLRGELIDYFMTEERYYGDNFSRKE